MCYLGPTMAAIITTFMWKGKKKPQLFTLMLMFYGGSLYGIIDHVWNGELLIFTEDWIKDVMLGIVVTVGIVLAWAVSAKRLAEEKKISS